MTFVIPVWNGADLLSKLLDTISKQTLQPAEVLVVNNASTDSAPEIARKWGARVIHMSCNAGFAAAANRGIAEAKSDWLALVNSDVELQPEWLSSLLNSAIDHGADYAGGKILMARDHRVLDGAWDLMARSGCAWRAGHYMSGSAHFDKAKQVSFLSATATLYHRSVFDRVGTFSEQYESYLEDVDLSLRCAVAELKGYFEPTAICLHHGSASLGAWSSRATFLIARNQSLLLKRLYPAELRKEWWWPVLVGHLLWGLLATRHGRFVSWFSGKRAGRRMPVRRLALEPVLLKQAIIESEQEIWDMQKGRGDLYWRLYFGMAGRTLRVQPKQSAPNGESRGAGASE